MYFTKLKSLALLCGVCIIASVLSAANVSAAAKQIKTVTLSGTQIAIATQTPEELPIKNTIPDGLESCFNYYTFGSVEAQISRSMSRAYQGTDIGMQGTITNHNPYPIIDAAVWVKVFHIRSDQADVGVNGPDVVDVIKVADGITLNAGESKPFSFVWTIPSGAQPTGQYRMATFVDGAGQFSLLGLTFTDDIIGDTYDFTVGGDDYGTVRFDKSGVKINDKPFYFAAFPPHVDALASDVTVSAKIDNTTSSAANANISWKLYYWDSTISEHLLNEQNTKTTIQAKGSTVVSFKVTDTSHTVYYLVGELTDVHGGKSVIGVRFVRDGVAKPRLAFVGVNQYPLTSENAQVVKTSNAFVCVHSTSNEDVQNGSLMLSAFSHGWFGTTTLATKTYSGVIPTQMLALAFPLVNNTQSFTLQADLYKDGKLVESKSVQYNCEDLQNNCPRPISVPVVVTLAVALIALLYGIYVSIRKHYKYNGSITNIQ